MRKQGILYSIIILISVCVSDAKVVRTYRSYIDAERDARIGVPEAKYEVAKMYFEGIAVGKNDKVGLEWLNSALVSGDINAAELRGDMFWKGLYGEKLSKADAIRWYIEAAKGGNRRAATKLALIGRLNIGDTELEGDAIEEYWSKSIEGSPEIATLLGILELKGIGGKVNHENGIAYLEAGKNGGNDLGYFEFTEELVKTNKLEAAKNYEYLALKQEGPRDNSLGWVVDFLSDVEDPKVVELSNILGLDVNAYATNRYGSDLIEGVGRYNKDYGVELLKRSADKGVVDSVLELGKIAVSDINTLKDGEVTNSRAKRWVEQLEKLASNDNAMAAAILSNLYALGVVVDKDDSKVREYASLSMKNTENKDEALYILAVMSLNGIGFDKNEENAYKLLSSIKSNFPEKDILLGELYFNGIGVERNYAKAFNIFKDLRDSENQKVLFNLAFMYSNGLGTVKDDAAALQIYYTLANREHAESAFIIANYLEEGRGLERDVAEAMKWLQTAGMLGHVGAQEKVGAWYLDGIGARRDIIRALGWLLFAEDTQSNELRAEEVAKLEDSMEKRDIFRAKLLVRDMKRKMHSRKTTGQFGE